MSSRNAFQLLVIDDDSLVIQSLRLMLPENWTLTHFKDLPAQLNISQFHAAFVDMHLTGDLNHAQGPQVIAQICAQAPHIQTIGISGDMSLQLMEDCLKKGAIRFLAKPILKDEVIAALEKIETWWQLHQAETRGSQTRNSFWIGSSDFSDKLKMQVASLRGEPGPILIEGETGTGKEVVFNMLNQSEPNRHAIHVNIASIPENLFESEMYGHVKGAFTGAEQMKMGLCEAAHGGDLFLDEIEAMPLSQQVKLLRFLESGEIRKVGAKNVQLINARVIVATNQSLDELVKKGLFREDLKYRLSGKTIRLLPLKERSNEIEELAKHFLAKHKPRSNKYFSPEAMACLKKYSWPGNVRELKRICDQLALVSPLPVIREQDVAPILFTHAPAQFSSADLNKGLDVLVQEFEAKTISETLQQYKDVEKAAEILKISRSSIYKKIKDYGLQEST